MHNDRNDRETVVILFFAVVFFVITAMAMYHAGRYSMKHDIRDKITSATPKPTQIIKIPELEITLVPFDKGFIVDKRSNIVVAGDIR